MPTVLTPSANAIPLILVSEYAQQAGVDVTNAQTAGRLLDLIKEISGIFQGLCKRRFDERIDTIYHTANGTERGGDLIGSRELALRDDLKSLTSILNGDGNQITLSGSTYKLLPTAKFAKSVVRLNPYGTTFFYAVGTVDPVDSIAVSGVWGYGGDWISAGATVQNTTQIDAVSTVLQTSLILEAGMFLQIESEYLYVNSVSGSVAPFTAIVDRGVNGSTAAAHLNGVTIQRYKALDIVRRMVIRLVQWANEQNKAPLFGQVTIGDLAYPVDVTSLPADVISLTLRNGLVRPKRVIGIAGSTI